MKKLSIFAKPLIYAILFLPALSAFSAPLAWNIQHWTTKKGTRVYFVKTTAQPIVDIQIAFAAGSAYDGDQPGLAKLTNTLLEQGTKKLTADQIAEQLDTAGAILYNYANQDMSVIGIRSLTVPKNLNLAVKTFKEVLSDLTFAEKPFQRVKNQQQDSVKHQQQQPAIIAKHAFFEALYGKSPYAHPILGSTESIAGITRQDAEAFYKQYYVASNAVVAMVGNLELKNAKILSERILNILPKGQPAKKIPSIEQNKEKSEHLEFPSTQTHIMLGQLGIAKDSPDYFPLMIGNFILGSGMTSRLFKAVREKKGFVYHISSRFDVMKEKGPFYVKLQTRSGQASDTINLVRETLFNFITDGPSKKELTAAQKHITQSFALELASNRAILTNLMSIAFYKHPLDYLKTYQANVNAVTLPQVKDAIRKHLSLDRFILITVGKQNLPKKRKAQNKGKK